tara:strand:+ start:1669 stop:2325 length:657 start_codon:yes stop_codon:yes gene_type:complete
MLKKKEIESLIIDAEKEYGFKQGYKLLYVPWDTIDFAKIAFISLNPGEPPKDADLRVISDEDGNSYEEEEEITESPLTQQFLRLTDFMNVAPTSILTGAFCPFRSDEWEDFSSKQKEIGFYIGKKFWYSAIKRNQMKIIITLGHGVDLLETFTMPIVNELNAKKVTEIVIGNNWCKLRRFEGRNKTIIQLPHLSRFRIFNEQNSYKKEIKEIFKGLIY